jgi:hypothetical protein
MADGTAEDGYKLDERVTKAWSPHEMTVRNDGGLREMTICQSADRTQLGR